MIGICDFATQIAGIEQRTYGFQARVGFCDHIADGWYSTMTNEKFWESVGTSAHFAISRKGEIAQLVNIFDTAFAEGLLGPKVIWAPYVEMTSLFRSHNPNQWLISIEHEGFTGDVWTPAMLAADIKLKRWCIEECARNNQDVLRYGLESLTGHFMFDGVNRAGCPGAHWPREEIWRNLTMKNGTYKENGFLYLYHDDVPIRRWGSTEHQPGFADYTPSLYPGREAWDFGGTWWWVRHFNDDGSFNYDGYLSLNEGD